MARDYTKVDGVKYILSSPNKDGVLEYFVRLTYDGKTYPIHNYTKTFKKDLLKKNIDLSIQKEHLKEIIKKRDYVISILENEGRYIIDDLSGKTKRLELLKQAENLKKIEQVENKKIDVLFDTQFNRVIQELDIAEDTRNIKINNYRRHIKPYIGGMSVYDIKTKDIAVIFETMEDPTKNGTERIINNRKYIAKPLSIKTQKNILSILNNIFNDLIKDDEDFLDFHQDPTRRVRERWVKKAKEQEYEPIDHRLKVEGTKELLQVARSIYQAIEKIDVYMNTKAFLYASLMTGRRRKELWSIHKNDMKDEVVFISADKTKTSILEKYYIPSEAMKIQKILNNDFPFKCSASTSQRAWHKIKQEINRENDKFRSYDFRHLFVNIMGDNDKYFSRTEVSLCISHSSGDNVKSNDSYFTLLEGRKRQIFETYWNLLREKPID